MEIDRQGHGAAGGNIRILNNDLYLTRAWDGMPWIYREIDLSGRRLLQTGSVHSSRRGLGAGTKDAELVVEFHFEGDVESSGSSVDEGRHTW